MTASDNQSQTDGPAETPPGDGTSGDGHPSKPPLEPSREDEVSLLDILLVFARNKALIVRTVLVFTLLGVTYALLAPEEFTSEARVVREAQAERGGLSGGLSGGLAGGALSGMGINLGGAASGLTPQAFSDVLTSREVRLAVVRDTFQFPDAERPMTFVDYVNRPPGPLGIVLNYTIKLPWTLKNDLGSAISGPPVPAGTTEAGEPLIPSEEEDEALKAISDMISSSVNEETGLMTISVTAGGPVLASDLTKSFVQHLETRVREVRTGKVRERLAFIKGRFLEAQEELEAAENRLAKFLERNQSLNAPQLQFQRDRLQRQVTFKQQLYSDLQSQLTQTRLDLQRQQPVVTVVEKPVPPLERSAPRRTFILFFSLVAGGFFAIGIAFLKSFLNSQEQNSKGQEKIKEIRNAFGVEGNLIDVKGYFIDMNEG